jgi:hypothetical protein
MWEHEVEPLWGVCAACRATTPIIRTPKKQGKALLTESPVLLFARLLGTIVRQDKFKSLYNMSSARRAPAFVRCTIEEHGETRLTKSPVLLAGVRIHIEW